MKISTSELMDGQFARDTPWIRMYERLWPDQVTDEDTRRPAIAQEMRELRAARSLDAGLKVIGWWYNHGGLTDQQRDGEVRTAMRRLKASKRLERAAEADARPTASTDVQECLR